MATAIEQAPQQVNTGSDGFFHGAHLECQEGAEFVVLVCGIAADWSERNDDSAKPDCPKCVDGSRCPVCGVRVSRFA